jgi:hypothetical protein
MRDSGSMTCPHKEGTSWTTQSPPRPSSFSPPSTPAACRASSHTVCGGLQPRTASDIDGDTTPDMIVARLRHKQTARSNVEEACVEPLQLAEEAHGSTSEPARCQGAALERAIWDAAFDKRLHRTGPARVGLVLLKHRNKTGACYPGIPTIGRESGLEDGSSVRRAVGACEAAKSLNRTFRRSRRGDKQASNQYDLLVLKPVELVRQVAEGPLAVYAALLGRVVFQAATVEATSGDLASDAGVASWCVPGYLRRLADLGLIRALDKGCWEILALTAFAKMRPPGPAKLRPAGAQRSAPWRTKMRPPNTTKKNTTKINPTPPRPP